MFSWVSFLGVVATTLIRKSLRVFTSNMIKHVVLAKGTNESLKNKLAPI